jgi:hypothetical protein
MGREVFMVRSDPRNSQGMDEWIRDHQPTKADGDKYGNVLIANCYGMSTVNWNKIRAGAAWKHTSYWKPSADPIINKPFRVRLSSLQRETLILNCIGIVLFGALLAAWLWFSASHEAAAFNRLTTGPSVTTWDAVWLDLRVEAQ